MIAAVIVTYRFEKSLIVQHSLCYYPFICEGISRMQRPQFNQGFAPGMMNGGPGMPGPPGAPGMGPARFNQPGPCFGGPQMPPQQNTPTNGCFMPAATIRKISNTTPPQKFYP